MTARICALADLLVHLSIQMTMRDAHLAPAHKAAAVKKLSRSTRGRGRDRKLLYGSPAGQEKPTDTNTDAEQEIAVTEDIRERFGLNNALNYLIDEMLATFAAASEQDPTSPQSCRRLSPPSGGYLHPAKSASS